MNYIIHVKQKARHLGAGLYYRAENYADLAFVWT